jgi:hypothetical protein
MASLCTPRNLAAPDLIICCKPAWVSAPRKCFHLAACFASITASHGISLVFLFPFVCVPSLPSWSNAVSKPNHKCHIQLTVLNLARVLATVPSRSLINRAYIMPRVCNKQTIQSDYVRLNCLVQSERRIGLFEVNCSDCLNCLNCLNWYREP